MTAYADSIPAVVLDLPGVACPMPVLKAKKALAGMEPDQVLEVRSTDPHSIPDLAEFCRQTGHKVLSQSSSDHLYVTRIIRRHS